MDVWGHVCVGTRVCGDMCHSMYAVAATVSQDRLWSQFFASAIVLGPGNQAQVARLTQPVLSS